MGSVRVSTKYSLLHFCLLTVPYHSQFQKIFRVNSRKNACKMKPIAIFVYLFWPVIKQEFRKILSRFREQSKQLFLTKFLPHIGILECFSWKNHFFLNIISFQYAKIQMANERERNQSHYSTLVVAVGLLTMG